MTIETHSEANRISEQIHALQSDCNGYKVHAVRILYDNGSFAVLLFEAIPLMNLSS